MHDTLLVSLQNWANFYVVVGSSAGALTGLQFVVMALVSEVNAGGSMSEIRAFGSPTVVHFCAVLFIAATITAPWHSIANVGWNIAALGAAGTVYIFSTIRHARRAAYNPDTEDWFWYAGLPLASYVALLVTGLTLHVHPENLLFLIAGIALVLLYTGIHNAWDTVTYVIMMNRSSKGGKKQAPSSEAFETGTRADNSDV